MTSEYTEPDTASALPKEESDDAPKIANQTDTPTDSDAPPTTDSIEEIAPDQPEAIPAFSPPVVSESDKVFANLVAGVRQLGFLPVTPGSITASWAHLFVLVAIGLAIQFLFDLFRVGFNGEIAASGLPAALYGLPVSLFCAWCIARFSGRVEQTLALAVIFNALLIPLAIVLHLLQLLPRGGFIPTNIHAWITYLSYYITVLWLVLAGGVAVIRMLEICLNRRAAVLAIMLVLIGLPLTLVGRNPTLWREKYDETAALEKLRNRMAPEKEDVFYLQPKLLEKDLAALKPGRKGMIDLYFIGAAGYADEDVFMIEVQTVTKLFNERFDTEGRSMMLINNFKTATKTPIASVTSLDLSLKRMAELMDKDEDILFLLLTSHGSKDHHLSLDFGAMQFKDLNPKRLRKLLDASGIKHRVIVISACYSGGFIEDLKDENSLVITAASADKNSFGCGSESNFTYFGKAYFDEALRKSDSFIAAFQAAKPVIAKREKEIGFSGSDPQIFIGKKIQATLDRLQKQKSAPPPPKPTSRKRKKRK